MRMNRIRVRTREFLICVAALCFILYNFTSSYRMKVKYEEGRAKNATIKFLNKCSCDLLNKLSPPIKDFKHFPCLERLKPSQELKDKGQCVRTLNLPKEILSDVNDCVLLKFGRGTPICTHALDEDIHVSRALITRGMWEEELVRPMLSILDSKPNMLLLDIGCNIGVYTLSAALYSNRVICVDANFENLYLVSKSLTLGKLWQNVTLIWNAISENHGTVVLRKELQNVGGAAIDAKNSTVGGCDIQAHSVRLDDLKDLVVGQEIYMKLDVEGVEQHVLNSGTEFFKTADVRYVQMEFDTHRGHITGTVIIDIMSGYGFLPYTDCDGIKVLRPAYHSDWPYDVCFIRKTIRKQH